MQRHLKIYGINYKSHKNRYKIYMKNVNTNNDINIFMYVIDYSDHII